MGNDNLRFACVEGRGCGSRSSVVNDDRSMLKQLVVRHRSDLKNVGRALRNLESRPSGLQNELSIFGPMVEESFDIVVRILVDHAAESQNRCELASGKFQDLLTDFFDLGRLPPAVSSELEAPVKFGFRLHQRGRYGDENKFGGLGKKVPYWWAPLLFESS